MKYLNDTVGYLQNSDFDNAGDIINPSIPKDIPVIIMIQGNFCGYCTQAKPAFKEFADRNRGKVFCATIQGDGKEPGEKELGARIKTIDPNFQGYPSYVKYMGGKRVSTDIKGRDMAALQAFASV